MITPTATPNQDTEQACRRSFERLLDRYPNAELKGRFREALNRLLDCDVVLTGNPNGWIAGIIYAISNRDQQACGVPGLLNSELESLFDVSMGTIRRRAAEIEVLLDW